MSDVEWDEIPNCNFNYRILVALKEYKNTGKYSFHCRRRWCVKLSWLWDVGHRYAAVTGCASLKLPSNVYWLRGDDNELTVGCRSNARSWQLVCRNNAWHGSYGNCTTNGPQRSAYSNIML